MSKRIVEHFVGRCVFCNGPNLIKVREITGDTRDTYVECEGCGRVMWRSSGPAAPAEAESS